MKTNHNFTDFDTVNHVLEQIGRERQWTKQDIANDVDILNRNRVYRVNDLKALSNESWSQISLLPLVKDLLKSSIASPNFEESNNKKDNKKKDKKKKEEKSKGFISPSTLGTPVVPTIIKRPTPINQQQKEEEEEEDDHVSQDHLTIQNTILNGAAGGSSAEEEEGINNPNSDDIRRKSVSFSNETAIGVAASEKKKDKEKNKKKNKKKKDKMASIKNSSEYLNFKSHPYNATYPIIKFRKMKMKHCKRLPPVPANDPFLQGIHDKLTFAKE